MPLTRIDIINRAACLGRLSTEFEFSIGKPATTQQIAWRQKQLDRPIPDGLTDFAKHNSARVILEWELDPALVADSDFLEGFPENGGFHFNFYETSLKSLALWEDSFINWADYRAQPSPFSFDDIFPVFETGDGDIIVLISAEQDFGALYYIDHAGGAGDWQRLASSYDQFLNTLARLWFPPLDWNSSLSYFHDVNLGAISAETEFSQKWIARMNALTGGV